MAPSGGCRSDWFVILMRALLIISSALGQEIIRAPENETAFLSHSANFTCETRGGTTLWRVNGTQWELLSPELPSGDLHVSKNTGPDGHSLETLTLRARAEYNGTRVQCLSVIIDGPRVESENATLSIQGLLPAVADLRVNITTTSVTIWWNPPFSLIPDIWYSVFIYNVTDENNPTAILCTNCTNITETHYTFTPDYLTPCHVYNFSVVPINGAGQGESSGNVTDTNSVQDLTVTAIGDNQIAVNIRTPLGVDGVLMVMQCEDHCLDVFRVLPQSCSIISNIPAVTYTVYIFNLSNGLPNRNPYLQTRSVQVEGVQNPRLDFESNVLNQAKIELLRGSTVTVTCLFKEDIEGASCVLLYQPKYTGGELEVVEYPQNTDFPVTLTNSHPGDYMFAVFGKSNSIIDEIPIATTRLGPPGTRPSLPSTVPAHDKADEHGENMSGVAGGIAGALTVIIIALVLIGIVVLLLLNKRNEESSVMEEGNQESTCQQPQGGGSEVDMMSEACRVEESKPAATTLKGHDRSCDSGIMSGSADLTSVEAASSPLDFSSLEVESSPLDFSSVEEERHQDNVLHSSNEKFPVHQGSSSDTQVTSNPVDEDEGTLVVREMKIGRVDQRTDDIVRGPMPPTKQSRGHNPATLKGADVLQTFVTLQEVVHSDGVECDGSTAGVLKHCHPESTCPHSSVSDTAKSENDELPTDGFTWQKQRTSQSQEFSCSPDTETMGTGDTDTQGGSGNQCCGECVQAQPDKKCPHLALGKKKRVRSHSWPQKHPPEPCSFQLFPPKAESQEGKTPA